MSALFGKKKTEENQEEAVKETAADAVQPTSAPMPEVSDLGAIDVIIGFHMTEKASLHSPRNVYILKVAKNANKINIKKSVESLYKVKVAKVAVVNIPAKKRRFGRQMGWKSSYRKAIVTLKEGYSIQTS